MASSKRPKELVSYIMSRNKGKDTKPEIIVRKYLFSQGLRFRKNDRRYPGQPDIVLPKYRTIIFIHGCFWHQHKDCPHFSMPKVRIDFWQAKFDKNKQRDAWNIEKLESLGWRVIVVWECELKKSLRDERLAKLYNEIISIPIPQ
ncbi:very short patch repair endonuclease [Parabacteroides gordonii]|uniref:very short patch repair endonuclease n=1 Tax=Parabacteroides gordonii TaxID=574930 RepID=UPI000EDEA1F9|nr:DNA mismatch endonuclease Vsr [Parabacteroides gordonii]RGP17299.1 DNA mismatch endonuclease Vsr [Parabacteroides gordonii]